MRKRVVAIALDRTGWVLTCAAARVTDGIVRWAHQAGWELFNLSAWRLELPAALKVDGLIYNRASNDWNRLQAIIRKLPRCVEILFEKRDSATHCVIPDVEAAGLKAAEYYLERGFRHFALAAYSTDEWIQSLRIFKQRIGEAGGVCQVIQSMHLQDGADLETIRDAVGRQLRTLHYPLGIFCANDRLATRLCQWCQQEGIAVPEQAAILGYDNDMMTCQSCPVPLSSVDPNYEQIGVEAARRLERIMNGETIAEETTIRVPPREIVTRRSTDIMAVGDVRVAHALRYIWDHYRTDIGPDDVASFCEVPRRSLDLVFKKALGRTISNEILRQRLAQASDLLAESNLSSVDIAARVGFTTPQYFSFKFKKNFGLTPRSFREREHRKAQS